MVLRFNMSTPYEEKELAEAADTLFLDVWAFTNNWADIRLREEDVRSTRLKKCSPPYSDYISRSHHSLGYCRNHCRRHIRI